MDINRIMLPYSAYGIGRDGMGWGGTGWVGSEWDGVGWDGIKWHLDGISLVVCVEDSAWGPALR